MDGYSDNGPKSLLLTSKSPKLSGSGGRSRRLSRHNSVNSLRSEFVTRLPGKVRDHLDVESPYDIDVARIAGLTQGVYPNLLCSVWVLRKCLFLMFLLCKLRRSLFLGFLLLCWYFIFFYFSEQRAVRFFALFLVSRGEQFWFFILLGE